MKLRCEITAPDHPHAGCRGYIVISDEGTLNVVDILGKAGVRLELEDCRHGTEACYVTQARGSLEFDEEARRWLGLPARRRTHARALR